MDILLLGSVWLFVLKGFLGIGAVLHVSSNVLISFMGGRGFVEIVRALVRFVCRRPGALLVK